MNHIAKTFAESRDYFSGHLINRSIIEITNNQALYLRTFLFIAWQETPQRFGSGATLSSLC